MKTQGRSWKERICALLLALAMVLTGMLPGSTATAEAAPFWEHVDVTFRVLGSENQDALLSDDVTINVKDSRGENAGTADKAEENGEYIIENLDPDEEYTYTVTKKGYEYADAAAERKLTPSEDEAENVINVSMKMSEISLSETDIHLVVGETKLISVDNAVANTSYEWSVVSGSEYVSVDNNGNIIAKAGGQAGDDSDKTATVQVTMKDRRKTAFVNVTVSKEDPGAIGLTVKELSGLDQTEVTLTATNLPNSEQAKVTFNILKMDGEGYTLIETIGPVSVEKPTISYQSDNLIGDIYFQAVFSGDTKYISKSTNPVQGSYTKTQDIEIEGDKSSTVTYGEEGWNTPIYIQLDTDTIKGREIFARAELDDFGEIPNAVSADDVAEIKVEQDKARIEVTPKSAGKIKIVITAVQGETWYQGDPTEYILTVNRKTVGLENVTWDPVEKVYDNSTEIQLTGTVNGTNERITIDKQFANTSVADVVTDNENNPVNQDVTISNGVYYATVENGTANTQLEVGNSEHPANTVEDVAKINYRPLYLKAGNAEFEYGQNMKTAVENSSGLITLLNGNGAVTPGDKDTGLVVSDKQPALPGATITGTDERLYVGDHEVIVPALTGDNTISGNYKFFFTDGNTGILKVTPQQNITFDMIKESIVLSDVNAAGIYGVTNGDSLDKVFVSIGGNDEADVDQTASYLKLAMKADAETGLDDYYDCVYIAIGDGQPVNATNGISLDELESLINGETEDPLVDDIKIYLERSDHEDTTTDKNVCAEKWMYIDNEAPEAKIDNFHMTAFSKMQNAVTFGLFRNGVYYADITIKDQGSGVVDAEKKPQQYYVKELGSGITDEDLTQKKIEEMIDSIDQATDPGETWKNLTLSEKGEAVIPVGAAESAEAAENNYLIFIKTIDNVGNCDVYVSNGIVIERQSPSIGCEFSTKNQEFITSEGIMGYSGDVEYELTITDPKDYFSGIDKIEVTVKQDNQTVKGSGEIEELTDTEYENSFFYDAQDKKPEDEKGYTYEELKANANLNDTKQVIKGVIREEDITSNDVVLVVKATDRAGNELQEVTQRLFIDKDKPEITVEFDKTNAETEDQLPVTEYYQDSRTMTISYEERNLGFTTPEALDEFELSDVPKENIWFDFKLNAPDNGEYSQYSLAELAALKDESGNAMVEVRLVSDSQQGEPETQHKDTRKVTFELKFVGQSEYTIIPHCSDTLGFGADDTEAEYFVVDTEDPQITEVSYSCFDPESGAYVPFDPSEAKNTTIRVSVKVEEHFFKLDGENFVPGQIGVTLQADDLAENDVNNAEDYQEFYQNLLNDPSNWSTTDKKDEWKICLDFANDANYTFDFTYKDLAGRADSIDQQTFTYDNTAPNEGDIEVTDGTNTWIYKFLNSITFGFFDKFSNRNMTVFMKGYDVTSGVVKTEHYDSEQKMSLEALDSLSSWTPYSEGGYEIAPDKQFIPYMKVTDRAGNVSYFSTESGFVADMTGPSINLECTNLNAARNGIFNPSAGTVKFRVTAQDVETETYSGIKEIWYEVHAEGNASGSIERVTVFNAEESGEEAQRQNKTERTCNFEVPIDARFNSNTVIVTAHAVDLAGNEVTDSETVSIDITAPTIQVTYDLNSPLNERYYNATRTATVTVKERNFDESAMRFNITNTDGTMPSISGWSHSAAQGVSDETIHTCYVTFAADGDYTFAVNTTDLAGNDSETVTTPDFTIDQTDPTIQVSYDNNSDAENGYFNAERTATITVTEHNFNAAEVNAAITARLQGTGVSAPGLGSWSTRGDVHTTTVNFSADADYTFDIDYTDLAGNAAADYQGDTFTIDQTVPEVEFFDIVDKSANKDLVAPGVTYSDINYSESGVKITLKGAKPEHDEKELTGTRTDIANGESIKMDDFAHTKANDDLYTLTAAITDKAGNVTEQSVTFSVNRFGSVYEFSDATEKLLDDYYAKEEQDLVVTEINVDTLVNNGISYGRDGELVNLEKGSDYTVKESGSDVSWKEYQYTIDKKNFEEEGHYTVTIDSEDRATNVQNNKVKDSDIEFVIDKTAPSVVITGVENGEQYRADSRDMTVNVADNMAMGTVDIYLGDGITPDKSYKASEIERTGGALTYTIGNADEFQDVRAVARDAAGNEAETEGVSVLVTSNLLIQYVNNTPLLVGSIIVILLIAGGACWYFLIFKKKKNEQAK